MCPCFLLKGDALLQHINLKLRGRYHVLSLVGVLANKESPCAELGNIFAVYSYDTLVVSKIKPHQT
jgi:hypothetical protein